MLHYKEISYQENIDDLKKYKKNDLINVKILEIKDEKIRFSKRALEKDPWIGLKIIKKSWRYYYTRIHEVLKTGVKVSIDKDKNLIVTIKKIDLAKDSSAARPEVFSPGNALMLKLLNLI